MKCGAVRVAGHRMATTVDSMIRARRWRCKRVGLPCLVRILILPAAMRIRFPAFLLSLVLLAIALLTGCQTASYYGQAVRGHLQIVSRQQPIPEILEKLEVLEPLKARLRLVLAMREFAAQELRLPVNAHYLRYADLGRSNVVWNVTATPEFSMTAKTWWYPVVGRLASNSGAHPAQGRGDGLQPALG